MFIMLVSAMEIFYKKRSHGLLKKISFCNYSLVNLSGLACMVGTLKWSH